MKHLFITSSPTGPLDNSYIVDGLDYHNGFKDKIAELMFDGARGLIIAAYPNRYEGNDEMCDYFRNAFESTGKQFSTFDLTDDRYPMSKEAIESYDLIVLAGGHTPTQNAYFARINLRDKLKDFNGIIVGISAGSMNMADNVYFQPEEPGESGDWFKRDGIGLGLCDISICPHLQMIRNTILDGRFLVYDLIANDSKTREIIGLDDGSYIYGDGTHFTIYGRATLIKDGELKEICYDSKTLELK